MMLVGENNIGFINELILWKRCIHNNFTRKELKDTRSAYGWGTIGRVVFFLPDELYRFTKIFLSATMAWTAQAMGTDTLAQQWAYNTNEAVIAMVAHTFSRTYYSIGWAQPRAGLMLNSVARLARCALSGFSRLEYRLIGYTSRSGFPIDMHAFEHVLIAKIMRLFHIASSIIAGGLLWMAERGPRTAGLEKWIDAIRPKSRTVRDHLSIPIYEMALFSPNIGHRAVLKVAQIVEWGFFKSKDVFGMLTGH